jgi:hypothetical protein
MSSEFWVETPRNLWRFNFETREAILNSVCLIIIILTIVSSLLMFSIKPFYFGVLAIAIVASVYYLFYADSADAFYDDSEPFEVYEDSFRKPTVNNPMMNVPVTDYDKPQKYNDYERYEAVKKDTVYTNAVRDQVEDEFTKGLYQNPSDKLWNRENSQRQYISQPIGSVPNDTVELAQWLYGNTDGSLCKQGSIWDRYGLNYVENNCNGYNVSTPTNFGRTQP